MHVEKFLYNFLQPMSFGYKLVLPFVLLDLR